MISFSNNEMTDKKKLVDRERKGPAPSAFAIPVVYTAKNCADFTGPICLL